MLVINRISTVRPGNLYPHITDALIINPRTGLPLVCFERQQHTNEKGITWEFCLE